MSKTWIKILLGALFLLSAAALAVGAWRAGVERKHQQAIDAAESLYEEGHYAEAKEAFLANIQVGKQLFVLNWFVIVALIMLLIMWIRFLHYQTIMNWLVYANRIRL